MTETTLYVRLMNEGTDVFRPTRALDLGNGKFKLIAPIDYDPEDEVWEFSPNSIVNCKKHKIDGAPILLAAVSMH